jgi:hypothetical protein
MQSFVDGFGGIGAHHKKDFRRAFQWAAENDDACCGEAVHKIGMLLPVSLALQAQIGLPSRTSRSNHGK